MGELQELASKGSYGCLRGNRHFLAVGLDECSILGGCV